MSIEAISPTKLRSLTKDILDRATERFPDSEQGIKDHIKDTLVLIDRAPTILRQAARVSRLLTVLMWTVVGAVLVLLVLKLPTMNWAINFKIISSDTVQAVDSGIEIVTSILVLIWLVIRWPARGYTRRLIIGFFDQVNAVRARLELASLSKDAEYLIRGPRKEGNTHWTKASPEIGGTTDFEKMARYLKYIYDDAAVLKALVDFVVTGFTDEAIIKKADTVNESCIHLKEVAETQRANVNAEAKDHPEIVKALAKPAEPPKPPEAPAAAATPK